MSGAGCPKSGRKHTPIVSEKQRRLFGVAVSNSHKAPSLSKTEAKRHLKEVKGRKLPERAAKRALARKVRG